MNFHIRNPIIGAGRTTYKRNESTEYPGRNLLGFMESKRFRKVWITECITNV